MLKIRYSNQFKKDYKIIQKRGYDINKLKEVNAIELGNNFQLGTKYSVSMNLLQIGELAGKLSDISNVKNLKYIDKNAALEDAKDTLKDYEYLLEGMEDTNPFPRSFIITFENPCSKFDTDIIPHLFERFYRGDKSRNRDANRYGLGLAIAKNIVDYRETNGRFTNRKQLLKVAKLGPKAYEQCAGFMRILDGDNPLDATSVHPESYEAAMQLLDKLGLTMEDVKEAQKKAAAEKAAGKKAPAPKKQEQKKPVQKQVRVSNTNTAMGKALAAAMGGVTFEEPAKKGKSFAEAEAVAQVNEASISSLEKRIKNKKLLAEELGIGEITLTDILKELEKPARDPRDDMPKPILRSDVLDMKDLKPGMILKGTVRNVIDFGVFVDIGVHQDGLVHISQITEKFIKHPLEAVSVGDIVDVQVLDCDMQKKRISLTMKIKK